MTQPSKHEIDLICSQPPIPQSILTRGKSTVCIQVGKTHGVLEKELCFYFEVRASTNQETTVLHTTANEENARTVYNRVMVDLLNKGYRALI